MEQYELRIGGITGFAISDVDVVDQNGSVSDRIRRKLLKLLSRHNPHESTKTAIQAKLGQDGEQIILSELASSFMSKRRVDMWIFDIPKSQSPAFPCGTSVRSFANP